MNVFTLLTNWCSRDSKPVLTREEVGVASDFTSRSSRLDLHLSRLSLASLICLCMLTVGVGNAWGANVTYTVSSTSAVTKSSGTEQDGWTTEFSTTGDKYGTDDGRKGSIQMTSGETTILTLKGWDGYKITGLVLNMASNAGTKSNNKSNGTFSMVAGSTTLAAISSNTTFNQWYNMTGYSTTLVDVTVNLTDDDYEIQEDEDVVITISCGTTNSLYVKYYSITYEEAETCTQLGSINGSVSFSNVSPTSVTVGVPSDYSDKDNANLEGYIFKRYTASTGGSAVETKETNSSSGTTATFNTGLVANTTYYYTIIAKHSSSICNSEETSPRKSYTITSYTVSYANGGGSGTNPGAHSPVLSGTSVTLKANTFTAPAGKQFAGWNDGSNDYSVGASYSVTGNKTMTAQWSCITPTISGHPAAATYWNMDSPSALTVTATGGILSYQWQMSADGSSSWSNVGTNSSSYTPLVANGTKYYRCVVTNTGSSCSTSATSNNALVTIKTLSSIAVKTSPKTTYFAGETFDPTNLVITLKASDESTQDRSYASYSSGFTFSPTTATALTTSDDEVAITYGGESVDLDINVYSVTVNKVDDAGNSISADGVSASWTVGTKALAASYGSTQYRFKEWAFDGSNNGLSITSTSSANPTVTGTPTGNVTIKAVFYAPRVVKWSVEGDDSYDTGSPTESVPYGTTWSELKLPTDPTFSCGDKFMGWTTTDIGATGLDKDDDADDITALDLMTSSNKSGKTASKYQITGTSITFYGVIADYVDE